MSVDDNNIVNFSTHSRIGENVIDFTEKKLQSFAKKTKDPEQRNKIQEVIEAYLAGKIAIAWRDGSPSWIRIK